MKTTNIKPGEKIELGGLSIEAIAAYNFVHPKVLGFVGYIITVDGTRFWHAGDTGFTKELKNVSNIDVAMVPIGMGILTLTPSLKPPRP